MLALSRRTAVVYRNLTAFLQNYRYGQRYKSTADEGEYTHDPWFSPHVNKIHEPHFDTSIHGQHPRTMAGGRHLVSVIPGAGIGPEMIEHVDEVFHCAGVPVDFEWLKSSKNEERDFENMILSVRRNGIGIKGNLEERQKSASGIGEMSKNMLLRRILDLYVNVMEIKAFPGLEHVTKVKELDLVIMRQNTEGEYALLEHSPEDSLVENLKIVTRFNVNRMAHYAFQYAMKKKRRKIMCIHNSGVYPLSEGLFVEVFQAVAKEYPKIETEIVELGFVVQMFIKDPKEIDVVFCNSMYGGVFAAMLYGLLGGPALIAGHNIGHKFILYEPAARNKGRSLVGKGIANPTAFLMCGVAMLEELQLNVYADAIRRAIHKTLKDDKVYTKDVGGNYTTKDYIKNIIERIKELITDTLCKYDQDPPVTPAVKLSSLSYIYPPPLNKPH